jgi:hypothetical protein
MQEPGVLEEAVMTVSATRKGAGVVSKMSWKGCRVMRQAGKKGKQPRDLERSLAGGAGWNLEDRRDELEWCNRSVDVRYLVTGGLDERDIGGREKEREKVVVRRTKASRLES